MTTCPYFFPDDRNDFKIEYLRNERKHRDPMLGPAVIRADPDLIEESYWWNGRLHRSDGPAARTWDRATRMLIDMEYQQHDRFHRDPIEGPAYIAFDVRTGIVKEERYYFNGNLYRDPVVGP